MIVVPLAVRLWAILMREIDAIRYGQLRQSIDYPLEALIPFHSKTLAPQLGNPQTMDPVGKLKRGIPGLLGRMILLSRDDRRPKHVSASRLFEEGK
jgi:hypothetical protein